MRDGRSVNGSDGDLPIAAVMGDATAVTFGEIAAEDSEEHGRASTDDYEEYAG